MLGITHGMLVMGTRGLWGERLTDAELEELYARDIEVNQLERSVRRGVTIFLAGRESSPSLAAGLRLMSIVKDVERLGDYAKNFGELARLGDVPLAPSPERDALQEVAERVMALSDACPSIVDDEDVTAAQRSYEEGRSQCKACDELIVAVANSDATPLDAVRLAVGARHYKRVMAHLMNVLTGLLMPVHKLDFFDEEALPIAAE